MTADNTTRQMGVLSKYHQRLKAYSQVVSAVGSDYLDPALKKSLRRQTTPSRMFLFQQQTGVVVWRRFKMIK